MPRVSVVIPAYNYARFLPAAVESALRQTFQDTEIIVVDDGSTDETPQVARRFAGRLRYHRQANGGLSAARNAGCRLARGEFFAFLDADDWWDEGKIARQMEIFDRSPEVGLVSAYLRFVDAEGKVLPGRKPGVAPGENLADMIERGTAAPSTFVVRRRCFEEAGGFDEQLIAMEDFDFCLRVARRHRIVHVAQELGAYRVHGPSLSGNPAKVYPSYIRIFERLINDADARPAYPLIRRRLARYRYLWGAHQLKTNGYREGKALVRSAIATWPLVGWSLDKSCPWWMRLGHVAKPYAALLGAQAKATAHE